MFTTLTIPHAEDGQHQELWSEAVIGTSDGILMFAPT